MNVDSVCNLFRKKRITVLGLGLLGRSVGDVEFLVECGAVVTVTDKKSERDLKESVERLKKYKNVLLHLGGHMSEDFISCDMVLKAAGTPLDSKEILLAKEHGVSVVMSTALFATYAAQAGVVLVGVTGTRGKSTVSAMIYHGLKQAGRRAHLGGNVRGVSTLAMLPAVESGDIVVLELDSWQLQGFGDVHISPHVSVFTNFMQDHVNYYPTKDAYFKDKANIFRFQKPDDVLIAGASVVERIRSCAPPLDAIIPDSIPRAWKLRVLGEHNRENASLAVAALKSLGLEDTEIQKGVESFEGIEGRLQFVREIHGVKVYNDNNATTPEATIAALRALGDQSKRCVVLIVGGDDKKLDMSKLIEEISRWCSKVVMFKERGTDRIRDAVFALEPKIRIFEEDGLVACVKRAISVAERGETILYSPAFSSFGKYFKNEFDRNDQFLNIVRTL